jgi:hypothetical protein
VLHSLLIISCILIPLIILSCVLLFLHIITYILRPPSTTLFYSIYSSHSMGMKSGIWRKNPSCKRGLTKWYRDVSSTNHSQLGFLTYVNGKEVPYLLRNGNSSGI